MGFHGAHQGRGYKTGTSAREREGTNVHASKPQNPVYSGKNDPARALPWTRLPYSDFPRNEGVRGSNPRVGS